MGLWLGTSAAGRREQLLASAARPLTLYVCGPTVYDGAHVGHARTYLWFDIVRRHFEASGIPVRHVMNITDFEDKVTDRAASLHTTWKQLARREERGFLRDLDELGVRRPNVLPRAGDHIPEMRAVARRLVRTGRTVLAEGGLAFRPEPGRTSKLLAPPNLASHAVREAGGSAPAGPAELREFTVWQPPHGDGPRWPSPWGPGIPGWHLECYAMARRYLGLPVDLHGGGQDLIFPHHYAEDAIARAVDGHPFARHYLHPGFVQQGGTKMSKSIGNLVALRPLLRAPGPGAVRWYLLSRPYAEALDWSDDGLAEADRTLEAVRTAVTARLRPDGTSGDELRRLRSARAAVERWIRDDLRVDRALGELSEWAADPGRPTGPARRPVPSGSSRIVVDDLERRLGIRLRAGRPRPVKRRARGSR
jgi:cysteinyl-tRNA synthetase